MTMLNDRRRAFTLVELLVVIGIIALLISVLLPALTRARASANEVACMSNMRQIGIAIQQYINDDPGRHLPPAGYTATTPSTMEYSFDDLLARYLDRNLTDAELAGGAWNNSGPRVAGASRIWVCPSDDSATVNSQLGRRTYKLVRANNGAAGISPTGPAGITNIWGVASGAWSIRITQIRESSNTFVMTEQRIDPVSGRPITTPMGWVSNATIDNPFQQLLPFHNRRMNYLYADGHVQALRPEKSIGPMGVVGSAGPGGTINAMGGPRGAWTVRAGD